MAEPLRRSWVIAGALIVGLGLLFGRMLPWATQDRPSVEANPSLGPVVAIADVKLRPGQRACVAPAVISPRVRTLEWATSSEAGQPLAVTIRAPGFRARTSVPAASYGLAGPAVRAELAAGPSRTVIGTICLRNAGTRAVMLIGNRDPLGDVTAVSTVDGTAVPDLQLTLYGESRSFLAAVPDVADRISAISGAPAWVVWLVGLGLVVVVPLGAVAALVVRGRERPYT